VSVCWEPTLVLVADSRGGLLVGDLAEGDGKNAAACGASDAAGGGDEP